MARVTTLVYRITGSSRTSSPSTPTAALIRPPLLGSGNALYAPTVDLDGLLLLPFLDNVQQFYGPIISAAAVFVSPPLLANTQVFFPPTVNQTIYLPQVANEQSFYGPELILGQSITPPLLSEGQTFYGPRLDLAVTAPLLTNAEAFYGPTILSGTSVLPTPLVNDQVFYGPQLNLKVSPPLLTNSAVLYGPTIGQKIIGPATFASGQAFYPPQINLRVVPGWVSNSQTFYAPVVSSNQLIVAPAIASGVTLYGPKLNLKVTAPLLSDGDTIFAPAVIPDTAQIVAAPYHLNSQTFYGPQLNRNVKPALFTNTGGFFNLSVQNGALPGFVLSTPSVTVTSAVGDAPQIDLGLNADHYAGYMLDIQRSTTGTKNATDGSYTSTTLNISHMISPSEMGALLIMNTNLQPDGYTDPAGAYFQQYRIRREDGALSQWVEISGTVTAPVAVLNTTNGINKNSFCIVSTSSPLVFRGTSGQGANMAVRATAGAADAVFQYEVTVTTVSGTLCFGLDDGLTNLNSGFPAPGRSNSGGLCFEVQQTTWVNVYWNGAANQVILQSSGVSQQVGDVFHVSVNQTTGIVLLHRTRGGVRTQLGGNINPGIGAAKLEHAWVGQSSGGQGTVNFGASAFNYDDGSGIYA